MLMAIEPSEEDTRKKLMWEIAGHGVEEGWPGCEGDSWGRGSVVWSTRGSICNLGDNICHVLGVCWRLNRDYSWRSGFEGALEGVTGSEKSRPCRWHLAAALPLDEAGSCTASQFLLQYVYCIREYSATSLQPVVLSLP